jgi:hypothetical protein
MATYTYRIFLVRLTVRPKGWAIHRDMQGDIIGYDRPWSKYEPESPIRRTG